MWASAIVEGQIAADASAGLGHGFVGVEIDLLVLIERQSRSMKTLFQENQPSYRDFLVKIGVGPDGIVGVASSNHYVIFRHSVCRLKRT